MNEKPKKPSYNLYFFLPSALVFILIAFFVYAISYESTFFIFLAIGLAAILFYLFPLYLGLNKKQAEIVLQSQNLEEKRNLVEAEIKEEKLFIKSLREKIALYGELRVLTERLSQCLSLNDTSTALSREVNKLFGEKDRTMILYLFHSSSPRPEVPRGGGAFGRREPNGKTGELGIFSSHKGEMRVNIKSKKGDLFDQSVVRTMQPLLIEDTRKDYRFDEEKVAGEEIRPVRSLISVPLMIGKKALGILRIDSPHQKNFTTEDLRFLTTIADVGAVAIENAQLYERLEQLAIKDSLTGLYLRRYLLERLTVEVSRQMRRKGELSFLMFDLDKFKQYNDKFGHVAGDIVLRAVAMILTDFFRQPGDLVCRYGGEEFCVLMPDCPETKAVELAEALRKRIAEQTIVLRREKTRITVSIGVASFPKDAINPRELIHRADLALYQAKEKGRNQVCAA
ncbi:MAG: sensor domain-containing diguanylate cyclase [Candidatus Omnitrophica bacterium]|nr:sensor domain-containing diguanylate cyclase [Candidatus Omnitrophota bacterium]